MRAGTVLLLLVFGIASSSAVALSIARETSVQRPYPETSQRGNARIVYWGEDRSAGQLSIDYGQPTWSDATAAALAAHRGKRWRLGQNFWTSLDTNIALEIGGERLAPGSYYLVLDLETDGGFSLIALDPRQVRERRLDASQADRTEGGIEIPLVADVVDRDASRLTIVLNPDERHPYRAQLAIQWGPHRLRAPIMMLPDPK
jgi:hypothetical protein